MTDAKLSADFKTRLLERRKTLEDLKETGAEAAKTVELDQTRTGRLTRMDALQGQAMSREQQRRREVELVKIAAALDRIETGEFGFCVSCGEEIAEKRLELDPATPLCIDCAARSETR